MDNLIFEKTATHAILSATAFFVLFGFLFFLQTSSCNKAYRNSLLYLVLIDIFWNGLNVLSQLPITEISQFWMFNIASYFWIQIGFALLMSGAALTQERIHFTFWRVWNVLAVIVTVLATLFHKWYSVLTPEWYGYSARNTTFENIVTLLAIVPPILCCIYIIAKNAFKAKDKTIKSALTFLLISVVLAFFAGLFLDVVLTRFNFFVYGESSSIIGFVLILLFCRTALVLSQYSMNIQHASEVVIEQLDEGVILVSEQGEEYAYEQESQCASDCFVFGLECIFCDDVNTTDNRGYDCEEGYDIFQHRIVRRVSVPFGGEDRVPFVKKSRKDSDDDCENV
ncbi:MAG: hypothetical protein WCS54_07420, partial [Fibrobacteraceae bacterium]